MDFLSALRRNYDEIVDPEIVPAVIKYLEQNPAESVQPFSIVFAKKLLKVLHLSFEHIRASQVPHSTGLALEHAVEYCQKSVSLIDNCESRSLELQARSSDNLRHLKGHFLKHEAVFYRILAFQNPNDDSKRVMLQDAVACLDTVVECCETDTKEYLAGVLSLRGNTKSDIERLCDGHEKIKYQLSSAEDFLKTAEIWKGPKVGLGYLLGMAGRKYYDVARAINATQSKKVYFQLAADTLQKALEEIENFDIIESTDILTQLSFCYERLFDLTKNPAYRSQAHACLDTASINLPLLNPIDRERMLLAINSSRRTISIQDEKSTKKIKPERPRTTRIASETHEKCPDLRGTRLEDFE